MQVDDTNWIDYGIAALIGISVVMGVLRGFVREALSLVTWVSALILGALYYEPVSNLFLKIPLPFLRMFLAFLLIVLVVLIVGGILSYLTCHLIKFTGFGVTDRIIGVIFGFARAGIVLGFAIMLVMFTPFTNDKLWQSSKLVPRIQPLAVWMKDQIPDQFKENIPAEVMKKWQELS